MDNKQNTSGSGVVVRYREFSPEEKLRIEAYYREKRLHDEASALGSARREGLAEGIVKGVSERLAVELPKDLTENIEKKLIKIFGDCLTKRIAEEEAIDLAVSEAEAIIRIINHMRRLGYTEEQLKQIVGNG